MIHLKLSFLEISSWFLGFNHETTKILPHLTTKHGEIMQTKHETYEYVYYVYIYIYTHIHRNHSKNRKVNSHKNPNELLHLFRMLPTSSNVNP